MSKKRSLLSKLKIEEISGVDRGANPGAKVMFWKKDDQTINNQGDQNMDFDALAKRLDDLESVAKTQTETIEKLQAENTELQAFSKMSDAEKEFIGSMSDDEKAKFMGMDADKRKEYMDKAKMKKSDDSESVYKAEMDAIAKRNQELEDKIAKMEEAREYDAFIAKASQDVPSLKSEMKADFAKSLFKMDEASREVVLKELKAAEKVKSDYIIEKGTSHVSEDSAEGKLETLAKKYADEHNVTKEAAMTKVLMTPQGQELYNSASKN